MKNAFKRLSLIFLSVFLLSTTTFASENAIGRSSSYIMGASASIKAGSNGTIIISFRISSYSPMSQIGATTIEVYEDNGYTTECVATYSSSEDAYKDMVATGKPIHSGSITHNGTVGYNYYAKVYLIAYDNAGGDTVVETSATVTAKKK